MDRVLLSAVDRLLFVPEAEVVALALPCAASLLRAMNHNPARRASPAHDELMAKVRFIFYFPILFWLFLWHNKQA